MASDLANEIMDYVTLKDRPSMMHLEVTTGIYDELCVLRVYAPVEEGCQVYKVQILSKKFGTRELVYTLGNSTAIVALLIGKMKDRSANIKLFTDDNFNDMPVSWRLENKYDFYKKEKTIEGALQTLLAVHTKRGDG